MGGIVVDETDELSLPWVLSEVDTKELIVIGCHIFKISYRKRRRSAPVLVLFALLIFRAREQIIFLSIYKEEHLC